MLHSICDTISFLKFVNLINNLCEFCYPLILLELRAYTALPKEGVTHQCSLEITNISVFRWPSCYVKAIKLLILCHLPKLVGRNKHFIWIWKSSWFQEILRISSERVQNADCVAAQWAGLPCASDGLYLTPTCNCCFFHVLVCPWEYNSSVEAPVGQCSRETLQGAVLLM